MLGLRPVLLFLAASTLFAQNRIGETYFFGYKGLDVEAVRKALPIKPGDALGPQTKEQIRAVVKSVTGRDATDVATVCCDKQGALFVYIGLAGQSSKTFTLNPEPAGKAQVSAELSELSQRMNEAMFAAVRSGTAAEEQPSPGYRLPKDPKTREATLAFRDQAARHRRRRSRIHQPLPAPASSIDSLEPRSE